LRFSEFLAQNLELPVALFPRVALEPRRMLKRLVQQGRNE